MFNFFRIIRRKLAAENNASKYLRYAVGEIVLVWLGFWQLDTLTIREKQLEKKYKYLGYFLLLLIPLTFVGFYKTYFSQFPAFEKNIDAFIHFHAFIASIWILLLIVQPLLIINKKHKIHIKVGKISFFIFPLLILSFIPQMIKIINSENSIFLFFPLSDSILLILFYSLAIYNRKTAPKHMRYMIATTLVFLGPTVGRIGPILLGWSELLTQNVQYGIIYLILVSLIFLDKSNSKDFKPYLIALACWIIHQVVFLLVFV